MNAQGRAGAVDLEATTAASAIMAVEVAAVAQAAGLAARGVAKEMERAVAKGMERAAKVESRCHLIS